MNRLITDSLKIEIAKDFVDSFTSNNELYYLFTAKTLPYGGDDETIEDPNQSISNGFYKIYEDMIFAKNITPSDVSLMIKNNIWSSGETYDMYDDKDNDLSGKKFFVISEEPGNIYSVFKCIYNGRTLNSEGNYVIPPSIYQPLSTETSPDDEYYRTADGYVWKLMGTMTSAYYNKFATLDFSPLPTNTGEVQQAAVNGTIEFIEVVDGGSGYNSYAYGNVKEAFVGGDSKIFSLQTDTDLDIITFGIDLISGSFVYLHDTNVPKKVFFRLANNSVWSVSGTTYAVTSQSIVRFLLDSSASLRSDITEIFQTTTNDPSGDVSAVGGIVDIRRDLAPTLSANTDFYKNSSFYIRSGTGAGQVKTITEYIVTGNERRILIDEPFSIAPDTSSRFEIGPRVYIDGNGTGSNGTGTAKAIANVGSSGNTIIGIEMIDVGKNYTYASVRLEANTGLVDINTGLSIVANSAISTPIISPPGGHGSNPPNELVAESIGISTSIIGSEGGKLPTQNDYRTLGIIKSPLIANTELELADSALLFADGDTVTQPFTQVSGVVSNRQGNILRVTNVNGQFVTGYPIVSSSGSIESVINNVDRTIDIADQRTKFTIEMTSLGPQGTGFLLDEYVIQEDTTGSGYVYSISNDRVDLVGVRGVWNVSDDISGYVAEMVGTQSGAIAKITGKIEGDFVKNSGKILYLENMEPISRSQDQTERLKIVLRF